MKYHIDAFRFRKKQILQKKWSSPDIGILKNSFGGVRILDTKIGNQTIIIIPDGPNVIEHYYDLVKDLRAKYRVVIFDLPGFGFSYHNGKYDFSFQKTNQLIFEILQNLNLKKINLAFPCANGFYGLSFTQAYPELVNQLFLIQTPSMNEMAKWTKRVVPSVFKIPFVGQLVMPFAEKKFASKWYDYALPKDKDRTPYQVKAVKAVEDGGTFCLCSLVQGLLKHGEDVDLKIDNSISTTLIYGDTDFTHKGTNFQSILKYHDNVEIIKFESCGHFPDLEESDKFLKILKEKI